MSQRKPTELVGVWGVLTESAMGPIRRSNGSFRAKDGHARLLYGRRQMLEAQRKALPIASVSSKIVEEVKNNDILIIVGETGSGKTTQLPQFLFDAGFCSDGKIIGITQPRRVAAVSVAKRVAEESGVELGERVGYSIRFDDVTSNSTKIKYMTDGFLLREALLDPFLSRYCVIIIDEAHERTVHTDVLLGLLKRIQNARSINASEDHGHGKENYLYEGGCKDQRGTKMMPRQEKKLAPLKLVIMSASLDARVFSKYFNGAKAVHVQGRLYPVEILYTYHPEPDYVDAALVTIFQIHLNESLGDVLVFLTGQEEIEFVERRIKENTNQLPEEKRNLVVVPIYSSLPSEQQMKVFKPAPPAFRKVILATNVAETSVTIPGIKYVVDPGLVKVRSYNPVTGIEALIVIPTSKAQALQRSGRAGREGPGKCFRLYPESEFWKLRDSIVPEIKRCNVANVVLQLRALGIKDILGFDFIDKPPRMAVVKSLEQLLLLGALSKDYELTDPVGYQMAQIPLDPQYSKALILAKDFNCLEEMLIVVAMLSVESIFYIPHEKIEKAKTTVKCFSSPEGDHSTLINVYRAAEEALEKSQAATGGDQKRVEKHLGRWCKENFINRRSLKHARDVHSQIQGYVKQMGFAIRSCGDDPQQFRRCLAAAFFLNVALKQPDGTFRALGSNQTVRIHPASVLFRSTAECVVFNELVRTNQNYIRSVSSIDPLWLPELAPHYFSLRQHQTD
ncbi:RNA helicase family protein [Wolffia australiana]